MCFGISGLLFCRVDVDVDLSTSDSEDSDGGTIPVQRNPELGECSQSTSCSLSENEKSKIEES